MKPLDCLRISAIGASPPPSLGEAERLALEDHLQHCETCASRTVLMRAAARALRDAPPLEPTARERALRRAALTASRKGERSVEASPRGGHALGPRAALVAALAVVAVALLSIVVSQKAGQALPGATLTNPAAAALTPLVAQPSVPTVALAADEALDLEGARVTALRAGTIEIDRSGAEVRLLSGAMRFEVEPGRSTPFRVLTPELEVFVLGTIFTVDGATVSVERGRVRVTSERHGSVELGAGEHVVVGEPGPEPAPPSPVSSPAGSGLSAQEASALLAQARKHLASGQVGVARRLVGRVLAGRPTRANEAEAQTLLAECALVAGDHEEAARRYAEVAKRHADQPAGEAALFASAREAHASGKRELAKQRFEQYLARYPRGQFVQEARARLSQLSN